MPIKQRLKIVLLNQYIGAIAIGYLVGRGIEVFLLAFMPTLNALLTQRLTDTDLKYDNWALLRGTMISSLVLAGGYFLIAYIFALWLYEKPIPDQKPEATREPS